MIDRTSLRQDMDVLASDGIRLGKIDAIEGDRIKLTKDASPDGQHHYVTFDDVARVDNDNVYLSRTRDSVLGLGAAGAGAFGATAAHASTSPEYKSTVVHTDDHRRNNMLPWILGALALLALALLLTQCGRHDNKSPTTTEQTVTQHYAGAPLKEGSLAYNLDQFLASKDGLPRTFTFDKLNFDTGSATIRDADKDDIADIARVMAGYPNARAAIIGYTDAKGNPNANTTLGADRAKAVIAALQASGIDPSRLEARTGGENNPVASNADSNGRFENRRTDFVVLKR